MSPGRVSAGRVSAGRVVAAVLAPVLLAGLVAAVGVAPAAADEPPLPPAGGEPSPGPTPPTPTGPAPTPTEPAPTPTEPAPTPTESPPTPTPVPSRLVVATSVQGRQIVAVRRGDPAATRVLVVLGQMHGDEPAGIRVARAVLRQRIPAGVQVWVVRTMNPDGRAAGTRRNARGVDLNRNFPQGWRATATSPLYAPGRRPASEPETRGMLAFLRQVRPDLLVSFHQAYDAIDVSHPKAGRWAAVLARWTGLRGVRVPCRGPCAGTLTGWLNAREPGVAITVELPGRVPSALVRRAADASLRLATRVPDRSLGLK
ncbi:MAG: DUF2817 domain-containing protein [Candidatus Nanopelagicales bacterium]